mmetsp:Transcript_82041/g.244725  ORF Transcript_82041/g.244725 Transcript_82041/m.244725 type:complete len:227 (-) Transcript_82041:442-1122(-)
METIPSCGRGACSWSLGTSLAEPSPRGTARSHSAESPRMKSRGTKPRQGQRCSSRTEASPGSRNSQSWNSMDMHCAGKRPADGCCDGDACCPVGAISSAGGSFPARKGFTRLNSATTAGSALASSSRRACLMHSWLGQVFSSPLVCETRTSGGALRGRIMRTSMGSSFSSACSGRRPRNNSPLPKSRLKRWKSSRWEAPILRGSCHGHSGSGRSSDGQAKRRTHSR